MKMKFDNFTGYVLAGGRSSRMGSDKAFLELCGGETFLNRAVSRLAPICENRTVVLNHSQQNFIEKLPKNIKCIFDAFENRGAPGGIHAALEDCKTEYALILAVDLPFITTAAMANLAAIAAESKKVAAVVPIQSDGRIQPLCAVYRPAECLQKLSKLLAETTSVSARDFLALIETRFVEQNELTIAGNDNLFFNVNRPEDFQKLDTPLL